MRDESSRGAGVLEPPSLPAVQARRIAESPFDTTELVTLGVERPKRWARPLRSLVLMASDMAVIAGVGLLMIRIWAMGVLGQPLGVYLELWPLALLFPLGFATMGLYPGFGLGAIETLRRLARTSALIFLVLAAGSFVLKVEPLYSRATFFLAWIGILVLLAPARFVTLSLVTRFSWWGEPAVVVGTGRLAQLTIATLREGLTVGYKPVCAVSLSGEPQAMLEGAPVVRGFRALHGLAERGFRVAVLATEVPLQAPLSVGDLQHLFRHVIEVQPSLETPTERVEVRNLGRILGIEFSNQLLKRRNRALKRAVDMAGGLAGVVLSAPLVALACLAVRLASRGPVFFVQEREGLDGRTIKVRKIRTMYVDAERRLEEYLGAHPEARREWEESYKLKRDPRVLPGLGQLLRRLSIDELPQLWSVLVGDMSLVGPRPFPEYHLSSFSPAFRALRRRVRPGLTGLWQVMIRSQGSMEEQETFDAYYIRNWSIWMDLYILGRTVLAVLAGRGAY